MSKPFSQVLVVSLMLLAFVGQTLAYSAMSCEMSAHVPAASQHMDMDHANMDHQTMDHSKMMQSGNTDDCCQVDCVCPANACSSVIVLDANVNTTGILPANSVLVGYLSFPLTSVSSSLFRPPIFA